MNPLKYPDASNDNIMKIVPKTKGLITIDLKKKGVKKINAQIEANRNDSKLLIS
jgi:hypothetical protein